MNQFFNTCRRCLGPKVIVLVVVIIITLLVFVPMIGVAGLIAAAPLIGCTVMCGAMAFFMGKDKQHK